MSTFVLDGPALPADVLEFHAREIEDKGYSVIPDVLSPDQVAMVRDALEAVFEAEKEVAKVRGWHNNMYKVAYMLTQKNEIFRKLPSNPRLLPLMKRVLGPFVNIASTNGLTMTPGGVIQELHMDQAESCVGHILTINGLHCLDDFTKANGGTRLVPYSHKKTQPNPKLALDDPMEKETIYVEAKAGSIIAYSGSMMHAGSRNTTDLPRRAVHIFFTRHWYKPQWDFPASLSDDVLAKMSDDELLLFGFGSQPPAYDSDENKLNFRVPGLKNKKKKKP